MSMFSIVQIEDKYALQRNKDGEITYEDQYFEGAFWKKDSIYFKCCLVNNSSELESALKYYRKYYEEKKE